PKLAVFITLLFLLTAFPTLADYTPHFLIDSELEWTEVLFSPEPPTIVPLNETEWDEYMGQANNFLEEGEPYSSTNFLPAELYLFDGGGGGGNIPEDAGLVMVWGDNNLSPGNYASAWKYDFGIDPDLSNSIIQVTVTPPSASGINTISFGIQDAAGNIRSWWWNVPGVIPGVIPYDVPTTVTINTALTGLTAAIPSATGYANNPAFNIKQAIVLLADENSQWVGGPVPVPPPGQALPGLWNYWHDLVVKI
ncbi:unnamed protein product, partial [marine sediment metagenome]